MVELDDGLDDVSDDDFAERAKKRRVESKSKKDDDMQEDKADVSLDNPLRELLKLIFDRTMMKESLKRMEVDLNKMPLGKISKRQIKQGYSVLTQIEDALKDKDVSRIHLADLSTRFFTLIPHDFQEKAPPLIDDLETVQKKIKLLETLMDVSIANNVTEKAAGATDPIVAQYQALGCELKTIDQSTETFELINEYVNNQRGTYFDRHKIVEAFEVSRTKEVAAWQKSRKSLGNIKLLWHGSGLQNYVGILSQGLRIAPPEAPVSGYRLGKGVYLADLYQKSAAYCRGGAKDQFILIMLCEAALGKQYETLRDHYMEEPQPGSHSTLAKGSLVPGQTKKLADVDVPLGKPKGSGVKGSSFQHNEYVVYSKDQVFIRYLLKVKVN